MRIAVPGTRVALVPPPGFRPSAQFQGFEDLDLEASIGVTELPTAVSEVERGLVGTVVTVDGQRALWVEDDTPIFGGSIVRKMMLILGDREQTALVVATSPLEAGLQDLLREALFSVRWTPDAPAPTADLPYHFTACPPLAFAARMGNVVLLTEGGRIEAGSSSTMMTIGCVPADASRDVADVASDHLTALPGLEGVAAVSAEDLVLASGAVGIALLGDGLSAGDARPIRVFQLVVRLGDQDLIAVGRADAGRFDALVDAFTAVARSLGRV